MYPGTMPPTPMAQGLGYDQYLPAVRQRLQQQAPMMLQMPAPPPRFPTPGRMDGMREHTPRTPRGMGLPMIVGVA